MRRGMQGHVAEPRRRKRAPVWHEGDTFAYLCIIYSIHMVIVHIIIPYSKFANPLNHLTLYTRWIPFFFSVWDYVPIFSFNCRARGKAWSVGCDLI